MDLGERFVSNPQNGLARAFGLDDRADAPSAAKGVVHTNATLFALERVMGDPPAGLEMAPSRVIYSIYGGENPSRVAIG